MQDSFVIYGGKPLKGEVVLSGAKNVALKIIIAALMFDNEVVLHNIPRINDVLELINLIQDLGGRAEFTDKNRLIVDGRSLKNDTLDLLYSAKIRVSFMLFAPLLYKFERAFIPNPGGCRLGARSIDRIIDAMKSLGIRVEYNSETGYYESFMDKLPEGKCHFVKPSHTGTELLVMIASRGSGTITIENAALEPEIDDLILFLNESGANIQRDGNNIIVQGVHKLHQEKPFSIVADRNEAITYAVMAIATKGDVIVGDMDELYVKEFHEKLKEIGAGFESVGPRKWRYFYNGPFNGIYVETTPYPGFMTDWQPNWAVLMTQAEGESVIHERMFENRFAYVDELRKVGAKIEYVDIAVEHPKSFYHFNYEEGEVYNQAIRISGPQKLHNGVLNIADLRAGATLAIAALIAEGESIVNGAPLLERGYENFVEKVTALGGEIKRE